MTAKTDIKFYVHTNNGAPQLENRFGCMLDVLDACLVNGFGTQNVASTSINDKEITLKFNQSHNFLQYQVIKVAGADQTQLNTEHRILSVTNNTVTFKIDSVLTNITGTLTCSLPPLGFEKPFSSKNDNGGGKGAYRSTNTLLASRPFLRVVDELDPVYSATYAKYAKVGIVEDMSDIDTMMGVQAPYDISNPNANWVGVGSGTSACNGWAKWYYATSNTANRSQNELQSEVGVRDWLLVGTSDYFYLFPATIHSSTTALCYGFGAFNSFLNTDSTNNFLSASLFLNISADQYQPRQRFTALTSVDSDGLLLLQRDYKQVQSTTASTLSLNGVFYTGMQNIFGDISLTSDNAICTPIFIVDTVLRGELLNLFWLANEKPFGSRQIFTRHNEIYMSINCAVSDGTNPSIGQIIIKIGDLL